MTSITLVFFCRFVLIALHFFKSLFEYINHIRNKKKQHTYTDKIESIK
jgi:hypothetical protein